MTIMVVRPWWCYGAREEVQAYKVNLGAGFYAGHRTHLSLNRDHYVHFGQTIYEMHAEKL
jgi:hypothetical protein